ncbi:hypothetical protein PR048_016634 [Dryococelus australis]|uniref:Uncharacterized protein n=1 Tax=Dryococelus australis TaxID=614101 RepID=A0ABQ9H7B9_9NEOP|nr:hypothetical protein PR048_016634 [Dryococelus australis]
MAFFSAAACFLLGFLREFQTDIPMVPFLHQDLRTLTTNILQRVFNKEVLETPPVSCREMKTFLQQVRFCYNRCLEESWKGCASFHLAYNFTRHIFCINQGLIYRSPNIAEQRLKSCLELLVEKKQISSLSVAIISTWMSFTCRQFWNVANHFQLILSHGNVALERGFSVNADVWLKIRQTVENIKITKCLIRCARNCSSRYKEQLESKRKEDVALKMEKDRKRQVEKDVKELNAKKTKIMSDADLQQADFIDEQIKNLK